MTKHIKIPWAKPLLFGNEKKYLLDTLRSTWISGGGYVDKFETGFARYNGSKYAITTSNGTTALHLALLALGIGLGDEVIVPGFTFAAAVNMVIQTGAVPVYADIDPYTWCIDPASVEKCVTKKTRAIIPVHIYGNVCDMRALKKIALKHDLYIIEDAAQASFSKYNNRYAGTFGDIGCFSFQATKTLVMGEGGIVLTNKSGLFKKMRQIRNHGMDKSKRYWHNIIGYNFRLTNMQAALGCAQLEKISEILYNKRMVYNLYRKYLYNEVGITMQSFTPHSRPVVWVIAVKIDPYIFKIKRDALIKKLLYNGIETRPGYYSFSLMPLYNAPTLPVSEDVGAHVISLPSFAALSEKQIKFICDRLKKFRK